MYVVEFTLQAKPGRHAEVAEAYSSFAAEYLATHPALESVIVVADEASGIVRGIGVWATKGDADSVNSAPEFAAFNDAISDLLAKAPERTELSLVHAYRRA